jgi:hypothetical protein
LIAERIPTNSDGQCQLTIDFNHDGETVKTVNLNMQLQRTFHLGRWEIPHDYWRPFGIVGTMIVSLDAALNVYQFVIGISSTPVTILGFLLIYGLGVGLLGLTVLLWRNASRRRKRRLRG